MKLEINELQEIYNKRRMEFRLNLHKDVNKFLGKYFVIHYESSMLGNVRKISGCLVDIRFIDDLDLRLTGELNESGLEIIYINDYGYEANKKIAYYQFKNIFIGDISDRDSVTLAAEMSDKDYIVSSEEYWVNV